MAKTQIALLIRHPSIEPGSITDALNLKPDLQWEKGEERFTPNGVKLKGRYKTTTWSYRITLEEGASFIDELSSFFDYLMGFKSFFDKSHDEGGTAIVTLQLDGAEHFGGVFQNEFLKKASKLGVALGIEVFPSHSN